MTPVYIHQSYMSEPSKPKRLVWMHDKRNIKLVAHVFDVFIHAHMFNIHTVRW